MPLSINSANSKKQSKLKRNRVNIDITTTSPNAVIDRALKNEITSMLMVGEALYNRRQEILEEASEPISMDEFLGDIALEFPAHQQSDLRRRYNVYKRLVLGARLTPELLAYFDSGLLMSAAESPNLDLTYLRYAMRRLFTDLIRGESRKRLNDTLKREIEVGEEIMLSNSKEHEDNEHLSVDDRDPLFFLE